MNLFPWWTASSWHCGSFAGDLLRANWIGRKWKETRGQGSWVVCESIILPQRLSSALPRVRGRPQLPSLDPLILVHACVRACVHTQLFLTLHSLMDYSLPGSSVHGIFQARILEQVTTSFSRRSSWHRDQTYISVSPALAGGFFISWATGECLTLFFHSVSSDSHVLP